MAVAALGSAAPVLAVAAEDHREGPPASSERSVVISDSAVTPSGIVVAPGTRIRWTNAGRQRHTSTADDGRWDSPALTPGQGFAIDAPQEAGRYPYVCRFHAYIRGSVTISAVDLAPPEPVSFGAAATLSGTVPGVPAGTPVRVERRAPGAWLSVGEAATDGEGAFSVTTPPLRARTAVRAMVATSASPSRRVSVVPRIAVRLRGDHLEARVRPARAGRRVGLERLDLDTYRWRNAHGGRVSRAGRTLLALNEPGVYRVVVPGGGGLDTGRSGPTEFRPARFQIG